MKTKRLIRIAFLGMILYVGQVALSVVPNIEVVSLFILIMTLVFKKDTLYAIFIFVMLEGLHYGFGLWWWSYLYVWPTLYFIVRGCSHILDHNDRLGWSVILGIYGLIFGALFAIVYIPVSFEYAMSYFIAGIFFDIVHAIGNCVLCYLLFSPLKKTLELVNRKYL